MESTSPRSRFFVRLPKTYVDHSLTGQASVLRFVEDTFLNGERVGGRSMLSPALSAACLTLLIPIPCRTYWIRREKFLHANEH
jgi:hypothetical protein